MTHILGHLDPQDEEDLNPDEPQVVPDPKTAFDPRLYADGLGPLFSAITVGFEGRRDFGFLAPSLPQRDESGEVMGTKGGGPKGTGNPLEAIKAIGRAVTDLFGLTPKTDLTPGEQDVNFDITNEEVRVPEGALDDTNPANRRMREWKRLFGGAQRESLVIPLIDNALIELGIPGGLPGLGAPGGAKSFFTGQGAEEAGLRAPAVNTSEKFVDLLFAPALGGLIPGIGSFLGARAVLTPLLKSAPAQKAIIQALRLGVAGGRKTETAIVRAGLKAAKELDNVDDAAKLILARRAATEYTANVLADVATGSAFLGLYGAAESYDKGEEFSNPGIYLAGGAAVGGVLGFWGHMPRLLRNYRNVSTAVSRGFIQTADAQDFLKNLEAGFTTESGKVFRGVKKDGTVDWRYAAGVRDANGRPLATKSVPEGDLPFTIGPDGQFNDANDATAAILQTQLAGVDAALRRNNLGQLSDLKGDKLEQALKTLDELDGLENIMSTGAPIGQSQEGRAQAERAARRAKQEAISLQDVIGPESTDDMAMTRAVSNAVGTRTVLAESYAKRFVEDNSPAQIRDWINMLDFHVENNTVVAERVEAAARSDALKARAIAEGLDLAQMGVRKPKPFLTPSTSAAEAAATRIYAISATAAPGTRNQIADELLRDFAATRNYARGKTGAQRKEVADRVLSRVAELRQQNAVRDIDVSEGLFRTSLYDTFAGKDRGLYAGAKVQIVEPGTGTRVTAEIVSTPINGSADVLVPGNPNPIRMALKDLEIIGLEPDDVVFLRGDGAPAIVTGVDLRGGTRFRVLKADPETHQLVRTTVTPAEVEAVAVSETRLAGANPITADRTRVTRAEIFDRFKQNLNEAIDPSKEVTPQEPELVRWNGVMWEKIGYTADGESLLRHEASGVKTMVSDKDFVTGARTEARAAEPVQPMKTPTRSSTAPAVEEARIDPKSKPVAVVRDEVTGGTRAAVQSELDLPTPTGPPITPEGPLVINTFTQNQRPHSGFRLNYTKVSNATAERIRLAQASNDRDALFAALTEAPGSPRDGSGFSLRALVPRGEDGKTIFGFEIPSSGVFRTDRTGSGGKLFGQLQKFLDTGTVPKDQQSFFSQHFGYRRDALDQLGGIYEVPDGLTRGNFGTPEIRDLNLTDKGVVKALQSVLKEQINGNLKIPAELAEALRGAEAIGVREQAASAAEQVLPLGSDFNLKQAIRSFLVPGTEPLTTEQGIKARIANLRQGMKASRMWRSWDPDQLKPNVERLFGYDSPLQPMLRELQTLVDGTPLPPRPVQQTGETTQLFHDRFNRWTDQVDRIFDGKKDEFADATLRALDRLGMTDTFDGDNIASLKDRTVPGLELRFRVTNRTTAEPRREAARLAKLDRARKNSVVGEGSDLIYSEIELPELGYITRPRILVEVHHPSGRVQKVDLGAVPGIPEEGLSRLVRESQRARVDRDSYFAIARDKKPPAQIYWERLQAEAKGLPGPDDSQLPYMRKRELRKVDGIDITYNPAEAAVLRNGELGRHIPYTTTRSKLLGDRVVEIQSSRLRQDIGKGRFITDTAGNKIEPITVTEERDIIAIALQKRKFSTLEAGGSDAHWRRPPLLDAIRDAGLTEEDIQRIADGLEINVDELLERLGGQTGGSVSEALEAGGSDAHWRMETDVSAEEFVARARGLKDSARQAGLRDEEGKSIVGAPSAAAAPDPDPDRLTDNFKVIWENQHGQEIIVTKEGKPLVEVGNGQFRDADLTGFDKPKVQRTDLQIDETAIDKIETLPGLEALAARVAVEQGADPARLTIGDIRTALKEQISPEIEASLQGLNKRDLAAVLDELDPFIGQRPVEVISGTQQSKPTGIFDNISPDEFDGEFVGLASKKAKGGRDPFTYFFPQEPKNLRAQSFELAKMLHGFDVGGGRRVSVGEFVHPTHPSLHGQIRKLTTGQYRVIIQDAADKTFYESLEVSAPVFENARSAVEFLHNSGFMRNRNPAIFGDFNHLANLPEPSEMNLREVIEMNREIAAAVEIFRGQTGDVPQPLIDYANDFIDNGWGRLLDTNKEVLLFGDENLASVGRARAAGAARPRPLDSDNLPLPIGKSENFDVVDGHLVQLASDDEMARINNQVYRKNYPNTRELRNLPSEIRQRNLEKIGEDAAQADRYLGMAYLDFQRPILGSDPNFNPISELDWMTYPPVLVEIEGKTLPGILKLPGVGPGNDSAQVLVWDSTAESFIERTVSKSNISQSMRPGDKWDMRTIDGLQNANYRPELRRTPTQGNSQFDKRFGLDDPDQVRFTTPAEYVEGLDDAAMKQIYTTGVDADGNSISPFVMTDANGIPGFRNIADMPEQSVTDLTDYYLRRIEGGKPLRAPEMLKQLNEAGSHANLLPHEVADFHEAVNGLAYLRQLDLRSGGIEDASSKLIARTKLGMQSVEEEAAIRRLGKIVVDGQKSDVVLSGRAKPGPSDDMASWEVIERVFASGIDRETLEEGSRLVSKSMIRKMLDDEVGSVEVDFGAIARTVKDRFRHKPAIDFSDSEVPKIKLHEWNMPQTVAQKHPTPGFFYQQITREHLENNARGRQLQRWLTGYLQPYDPDNTGIRAMEAIKKRGFRNYDDFIARSTPQERAELIPGDGILRQRERKFTSGFRQPVAPMKFETFMREFDDAFEGARRDHIRSFLEVGWSPATVTKQNLSSPEIQSSLAFNGGRFNPFSLRGKALKTDKELMQILDADGQVRIFGFSNDAARGHLRPSEEIEFFIENLIADPNINSIADIPENVMERIAAMKGKWDWMTADLDFWNRDFGMDDFLPEVLRGRLRIYAKLPGVAQPKLVGFAPSVTEANLALRGWSKELPNLAGLTRPEDAADREFLTTIKTVLDANASGFNEDAHFLYNMSELRTDSRDVLNIGIGPYEHLRDVIGRDGAMDPRAIMHLLRQAGLQPGEAARPIPSGFPKRGDGVVRSWFGGDEYRKYGLYFSKINEAKYHNNIMKIRRQTHEVDGLLSDAYGVPSVFERNKEAALAELDKIVAGIPVNPQGVQVGEARHPGVAAWMDQIQSIAMGEPGPREKQMDEMLQFWHWFEDNVNGFGRAGLALGSKLTGGTNDFAWKEFIDLNPGNIGRHYRPFGARGTFQNMMHAQAILRLGGSPAAAMVNFTQWIVNSVPLLGAENTSKALVDWRTYARGARKLRGMSGKYGPEWRQRFASGEISDPLLDATSKEWFDLHDHAMSVGVELNLPKSQVQSSIDASPGFIPLSPVKRGAEVVEAASLWMFNKAEKSNRLISAFGARRQGLEQGITDAAQLSDFSRNFIERTQFEYAAIGLPPIMSSPMMRVLTQFKPFMFNQMKFETDLLLNALPKAVGGRGERGAVAQWGSHLGLLGLVGGATGVAYSPYVFALASAAEWTGLLNAETTDGEYETSPDRTIENFLYRKFGRDFISQGLNRYDNIYRQKDKFLAFGALGWLLNADVSRRVSLSGPELFTTRMNDFGNLILGPTGSMYLDFYKMMLDPEMRGAMPGRAQTGGILASLVGGPSLGGFGGLVTGLAAAQALSYGGKDTEAPLVDIGQLYRNATGQARLGRSGSDGALFENNSGRRFLANIAPTVINMSDHALDLALSGVDVDIGNNIYAAGTTAYNQSRLINGKYITNQAINNAAIKALGFNPANRTLDRMYVNVMRDREAHRQSEASRIAGRIAKAMLKGQDFSAFLLELDALQIPYNKNTFSQRMARGSVDMLSREIEADLRAGLNTGRADIGVP